jgi:hypothetical protein
MVIIEGDHIVKVTAYLASGVVAGCESATWQLRKSMRIAR